MYYLSKGLAEKGKAGFGKVMAVLFAIMCIFGSFGGGNMFQGNQAHQMIANTFRDFYRIRLVVWTYPGRHRWCGYYWRHQIHCQGD
jgi:Na+/alanine symporter